MKVLITNRQRQIKINSAGLKRVCISLLKSFNLKNAELSLLLVNDSRMKKLNRIFRGMDKTTDVLSFPQIDSNELRVTSNKYNKEKNHSLNKLVTAVNNSSLVTRHSTLPLGDIVINLHAAKRQAIEYGHTLNDEVRRLLIHGFLHLIGYDHEKNRYQAGKMQAMEKELHNAFEAMD